MPQQSDVLIGLDVGATSIEAVACGPDGHQLARAAVPLAAEETKGGAVEQEVSETWRGSALALRRLAQAVPHLQTRTVALAITGAADGTWLIDEDGDPVGPAWLPQDRRAEPVVAGWRRGGVALRVREITGRTVAPSLRSAQLAWLARHRPEVLDRAASAFAAKDCVYFFCTGARASDGATAAAAFGDWRTGAYDARVLGLLDLEEVARLLPEIVDGARQHGELTTAAAAATGLTPGMPVVLAPLDTVAAALALGLGGQDAQVGGTLLGATYRHMRVCADLATAESVAGQATILPFAPAGCWLGVLQHSGMANVDWLVGSAERLLLDAGLIGLPHGELCAMLERRAAEAAPGGVSYRPFAGEDGAEFKGLAADTTFYDLLRGVYEGLAVAARDGYAALDFRPRQVRLDAAGPAGSLAHRCLAASLDAPVLAIDGATPAAGAALVAAVSLGQYPDLAQASRAWVEPRLREVQAIARKREARVTPGSAAPAPT